MQLGRKRFFAGVVVVLLGIGLAACSPRTSSPATGETSGLEVVVTTTFIGDVLKQVAGEFLDITVLLEPGQNPHSYHPTPGDMVKITEADAIFINGFGLEEFLDDLLDGSETEAEQVIVSEGIQPLSIADHDDEDHQQAGHEEDDPEHEAGVDPHVWFDPNNVMIWTEQIVEAMVRLDPAHADDYRENGLAYMEQLAELDSWIQEEIGKIPEGNRKLVSDHTSLGYFAYQYGFEQTGAVIPALTTEAETSGQELANLIDTIRETQVKAIFVGIDFDPTLAQRVAEDTGVELVQLYFGSLSAGDPAGTYLDFMIYDVQAITSALK